VKAVIKAEHEPFAHQAELLFTYTVDPEVVGALGRCSCRHLPYSDKQWKKLHIIKQNTH